MAEYETRTPDGRPVVVTDHPVVERRGGGSGWILALVLVVAAVIAAFAFGLIKIDQTSSGSLPKVETSGGSLPKFNVDTAKVDVGTKTQSVDVPTVDVGTETRTVEVPTMNVERADKSGSNN